MNNIGKLRIKDVKVACVGSAEGRLCLLLPDEDNLRPVASSGQDVQARLFSSSAEALSGNDLKFLGGSCFGPMIRPSKNSIEEASQQIV